MPLKAECNAKLNKHHFRLVREMHPDNIVDYLISSGLLNDGNQKKIMKKSEGEERSRCLLEVVKESDHPHALEKFVEALENTSQYQLAYLFMESDASGSSCAVRDEIPTKEMRNITIIQKSERPFQHDSINNVNMLSEKVSARYIISKTLLGEGTFGSVMKGNLDGHGDVAVKIICSLPGISKDQQLQQEAEAKMLCAINHKNVVKAIDFEIEDSRILLFMELMTESVCDKILRSNEKKLDEKMALEYLQQALEGLVHLHTLKLKPIVHREIKCKYLLVNDEGIVKLSGFGQADVLLNSSRSTDGLRAPKETAEIPYWQAPEVVNNCLSYGRKADVWSIGCCLVEMLTGYPPYFKLTASVWMKKASEESLSYDPQELVPNAAKSTILLLEKTFRRHTKRTDHPSEQHRIRPHSWEILADVAEERAKPLQQQFASLQPLRKPLQQKITPLQQQIESLQRKLQPLQQQLKEMEQVQNQLKVAQQFVATTKNQSKELNQRSEIFDDD